MANKKVPMATVIVLAITGLLLSFATYGAISVSKTLNSTGSIVTTADIGVYSDSACNVPLTTIDWGSISPGGTVTRTIYVKNMGNGASLTLGMTTGNWNPTSASTTMSITWNREGV